jgi:hypothetical protein
MGNAIVQFPSSDRFPGMSIAFSVKQLLGFPRFSRADGTEYITVAGIPYTLDNLAKLTATLHELKTMPVAQPAYRQFVTGEKKESEEDTAPVGEKAIAESHNKKQWFVSKKKKISLVSGKGNGGATKESEKVQEEEMSYQEYIQRRTLIDWVKKESATKYGRENIFNLFDLLDIRFLSQVLAITIDDVYDKSHKWKGDDDDFIKLVEAIEELQYDELNEWLWSQDIAIDENDREKIDSGFEEDGIRSIRQVLELNILDFYNKHTEISAKGATALEEAVIELKRLRNKSNGGATKESKEKVVQAVDRQGRPLKVGDKLRYVGMFPDDEQGPLDATITEIKEDGTVMATLGNDTDIYEIGSNRLDDYEKRVLHG